MPFINLLFCGRVEPALALPIARGVTDLTSQVLGKVANLTAVSAQFVSPEQWTIGGKSLAELGLSSFWLDVTVTHGTNTAQEKERYVSATFAFMRQQLGPLHEASYVLVHEVPADAWGYGGLSQRQRRTDDHVAAPRGSRR